MGRNIISEEKLKLYNSAYDFYIENDISKKEVANKFNIPLSTFYDFIRKNNRDTKGDIRRKYEYDENYFETIDCKDKAYWLGFITADGSIRDKKGLKITLSSIDRNHLEKFKNSLNCNSPINEYDNKGFEGSKPCSEIRINSIKMTEDLLDKGLDYNKTTNEKPCKKMDESLIKYYILGFFDGDGWLSFSDKTSEWGVCSSKEMCVFIKEYLEDKLDIKSNKIIMNNSKSNNNLYRVRFTRKNDIIKILNYLYDGANLYLDRKYEKYKCFINKNNTQ